MHPSSYAADGHRYKQEAQDAVAERRPLVQEIRDARDRHEATKPAFEQAKSNFEHWRSKRDRARQVHQDRIKEFQQAKAEYDKARDAFRARLEVVRAKRERRRQDNRTVAERAGVPSMYLDDVWVSYEPGGTANIYFGGVGKPNGPGHGHYVMDRGGNVTYRRDPFDPHGSQNFEDQGQQPSRWSPGGRKTPPFVGVVDGTDKIVSFKTDGNETLIADGDNSDDPDSFNAKHNHYGPRRESSGYFAADRGHYTGPGA